MLELTMQVQQGKEIVTQRENSFRIQRLIDKLEEMLKLLYGLVRDLSPPTLGKFPG